MGWKWISNYSISCTGDVTGKILLNFAVSNSFTQFVNFPTRSDNVLDLVFASDECVINRVLPSPPLGHSDHCIVDFNVILKHTNHFVVADDKTAKKRFNWYIIGTSLLL